MYPDYFLQTNPRSLAAGDNTTTTIKTTEEPTPVTVVPQPPNLTNYTYQGVIYSICIVIVINLGKPLVEAFTMLFSEAARNKKEKELKALDAPLRLQETMEEQQKFLQALLEKQQTHSATEMTEVLRKMTDAFNGVQMSVKENAEKNAKFLAGAEALKIEIQKVTTAIPIRIVQDKPQTNPDNQNKNINAEKPDNEQQV